MSYRILILGASYGSLLGAKFAAAGHDVTLVCRLGTADLINSKGTEIRIKLGDEENHRSFFSNSATGNTDAVQPEDARPENYDLICLAMQEPQYSQPSLRNLLTRIAKSRVGCMSIMNMPPLPYLKRIPSLAHADIKDAFLNPTIWDDFDPNLMTLCSPDPQAFRPPEELPNVVHVGLPTNFKVSKFGDQNLNEILETLARDVDAYRVDGNEVPVKLRVHDSIFVPLAKWAMLASGNYRCITSEGPQSIRDAVHSDINKSEKIYNFVSQIVVSLGADQRDLVPFEKYASAAKCLMKPSSVARAVFSGQLNIERVDRLIKLSAETLRLANEDIMDIVRIIDQKLENNIKEVQSETVSI
jgi:hypothetical protein